MPITADDISNILGLRMEGLPVKGTGPHATTYEECVELVTNGLGVSKEDVEQQMTTKQNLSLIWLKEWKNTKDEDSEMDKECAARAYLLHLIESVLCPDKTGNAIGAYWLQYVTDILTLPNISLGFAILVHLFHELGCLDPYENERNYAPLEDVVWYTGTMVCFDKSEPIYPGRVLRQLGMVQTIPLRPLNIETCRSGDNASTYRDDYSKSDWYWEQWRNALLNMDLRSVSVSQ
ncbi:hypothetical protein MKW98_000718, partial [Papaver atlanticum]